MKTKNMQKIKTGGFTLIELLVVISIIGLLASIVLASLNTARAKAKNTAINSNIKDFIIAANLYRNDNGNMLPLSKTQTNYGMGWCSTNPTTWEVDVCLTSSLCPDNFWTICKNDNLIQQVFGPYIKTINNPQTEIIGNPSYSTNVSWGPPLYLSSDYSLSGVPSFKTFITSCDTTSKLCSVGILTWFLYPGGTCAYGATTTVLSDKVRCELNI